MGNVLFMEIVDRPVKCCLVCFLSEIVLLSQVSVGV